MNYRLYLSQVGVLFSATAIAQLINFASYPFLSRTYDSADFGFFSIFMSGVLIVGSLAAGRFDVVVQAAPYPQRHAAIALATFISVPVSILSGVGYAWLGPDLALGRLLAGLLFGGAVFLTAFMYSGTAFLIKHEAYRRNGIAIVTRAALTAVPQIGLFWLFPDARGLALGFCIGLAAQALVLFAGVRKLGHRRSRGRRLGGIARRYARYPLMDVPSTFLSAFALYAGNFFLFDLYGAREAGFFSLAFRLAALPMALLAGSLSEVFFQKAAQAYHATGSFWQPLRFNLVVAGGLAAAVLVATLVLARIAVDLYLGPGWGPVATVLIVLAPMMAGRFLFVAISAAPLVTGRTLWLLSANALLALVPTAIYAFAKWTDIEFVAFLGWMSAAMSLLYAGLVALIVLQAQRTHR